MATPVRCARPDRRAARPARVGPVGGSPPAPERASLARGHGLRRFRLRGLENVNIEGLLIAAGQNLKRLLAATGWGRRHAPCGSLVALPKEARLLAAASG